ncbi:MAG: hypothetical protein COB53_08195 [Elusimicrobia bacterium]|nr:MAG: hypothetical protein COB53_08195 [Elusimicrobiota bacterium]
MATKKRIVIVEDDEAMQRLFRTYLTQDDHIVEIAGDGVEAVEKIALKDTDLVIMDFMLPKKGGYEIIKEIQEMNGGSPPVIAVTGRFQDAAAEKDIRSQPNVVDFFLKPVDHSEFMAAVDKALSNG